jgi:hypothetical protein
MTWSTTSSKTASSSNSAEGAPPAHRGCGLTGRYLTHPGGDAYQLRGPGAPTWGDRVGLPGASPKIVHISWGVMEVEGLGVGKDFKLYPGGGRAWDWSETGTRHVPGVLPADVAELLIHGAAAIVLSLGMDQQLHVDAATLAYLPARPPGRRGEAVRSRCAAPGPCGWRSIRPATARIASVFARRSANETHPHTREYRRCIEPIAQRNEDLTRSIVLAGLI